MSPKLILLLGDAWLLSGLQSVIAFGFGTAE
jgi:hypothetical protein